ncbi:hypothetical protein AWR27_14415 [Spirosoma montaniterrae]|uniref:DUF4907 domain-containing protein n=2 Tax=Spirosoma montaniterrae TaxID=1178516 RepID=A0A1P9WYF3_9BACT|nr:hypothetical protein AWR27_14415 [Spirosoma montaniterrae]
MKTNPIRQRAVGRWQWVIWLLAGGLLIAYGYHQQQTDELAVTVFRTNAGWGYNVQRSRQIVIHQPVVPGQSGGAAFGSEAQARRVGECVAEKLREGQFPPTLTQSELQALGIVTD